MEIGGSHVLITGGAGFIGSNLADALLSRGCRVTVLDNFATGKRENLLEASRYAGFRLIEGDIRNMTACRDALAGVDFVLHEAALGSVPRSIKNPAATVETNITGFVNMLFAAQEAKVRRFVYAASSAVYGDSAESPKVESRIGKPLSPYAITKLADEFFAGNFHSLYGIDTIGLRYFNVFGRRQDPDGAYAAVIPRFAAELIAHRSPVINGDGGHSRDFTCIDNVIEANLLALTVEEPAALNTVYNIAGGAETTLNELFEALRADLSVFDPAIAQITARHGCERAGDVRHSLADISRAASLLGYRLRTDVRSGLAAAAEWYFKHLKSGVPGGIL